jgi:hypothetical protein
MRIKNSKINEIKFSKNWNNKLNCPTFTTIRLHNTSKYVISEVYQIVFPHKKQIYAFNAIILDIQNIRLSDINNHIAYLDTGLDAEKTKKILQNMYWYDRINWEVQLLDYCLLRHIDSNADNVLFK